MILKICQSVRIFTTNLPLLFILLLLLVLLPVSEFSISDTIYQQI
jgi:hypothetical protein